MVPPLSWQHQDVGRVASLCSAGHGATEEHGVQCGVQAVTHGAGLHARPAGRLLVPCAAAGAGQLCIHPPHGWSAGVWKQTYGGGVVLCALYARVHVARKCALAQGWLGGRGGGPVLSQFHCCAMGLAYQGVYG